MSTRRASEGQIVAVGYSRGILNDDFAVVQDNPDGTLDTTFNSTGIVTTAIGTGADDAWAVAIQGDGEIVVAGGSYTGSIDFARRYARSG